MSRLKALSWASGAAVVVTGLAALYNTPQRPVSSASVPAPFTGTVASCHDGDTCDIDDNGTLLRVRLYGADAPELNQPSGKTSRTNMISLVQPGIVHVAPVSLDPFGRVVARITSIHGDDASRAQVAAGMAWWYQQYAPSDTTLQNAQTAAQAAHRGVWGDPEPIAPWVWRQTKHTTGGN